AIWMGLALILVVSVFTLTPVLFIVINSLNSAPPNENWRFGFEGWREAFGSPRTLNAIGYTFLLNIRSLVGIAIAFVFSWLLTRVRIPLRNFIEFSLWIAYFLPLLPLALSWILLLDPNYGLINQLLQRLGFKFNVYSVYGIVWIHLTASTIPIMTILLAPVMRQIDASLEEAARMCGAGSWQTFRRVLIPVLAPALFTVLLAALIRGLEAFQIELLLGKPIGIYVYATRIYDLIQWEPPLFPQAMALSTLFLGILFLLALFYQRYTSKRSFATVSARGVSFRPMDVGRGRYWISAFLVIFVLIGVYLPLGILIVGSLMKLFGFFSIKDPFSTRHWLLVLHDPVFLTAVRNSIVLGIGTASVGLLCYCLLGYALVRTKLFGKSLINLLIWLPWAIPGILLGLAFLWLFLSTRFLSPLYGSYLGLLMVLLIKEMPIGVHMTKTAFVQISEELEQVGRVCGANWFYTFRRIILPLVSPVLVSIFAIVFMGAIRDIDTIILVGTASTRPLSLLMMEYSMAGEMQAASILGVILSLFAIVIALVSRKIGLRSAA
ncbi:MAG TPA: iron ABC transporter permease, partial [Candidatus Acidoferrales bacterium]|nr:iron ABC transporter permease [Candidatus Acidoferrales bacterium]